MALSVFPVTAARTAAKAGACMFISRILNEQMRDLKKGLLVFGSSCFVSALGNLLLTGNWPVFWLIGTLAADCIIISLLLSSSQQSR